MFGCVNTIDLNWIYIIKYTFLPFYGTNPPLHRKRMTPKTRLAANSPQSENGMIPVKFVSRNLALGNCEQGNNGNIKAFLGCRPFDMTLHF